VIPGSVVVVRSPADSVLTRDYPTTYAPLYRYATSCGHWSRSGTGTPWAYAHDHRRRTSYCIIAVYLLLIDLVAPVVVVGADLMSLCLGGQHRLLLLNLFLSLVVLRLRLLHVRLILESDHIDMAALVLILQVGTIQEHN
jgi:hypothetical protein